MEKRKIDTTILYGKVPPQAKAIESAVLGAIMLEKGAFDRISELLRPEMFYVEANQMVFNAMVSLSQKSQPIDVLTVEEEVEDIDKIGGRYYLTKLTNDVVSSANLEAHAQIVSQKFVRREVIRLSGEILNDAYDETIEVEDIAAKIETELVPVIQLSDNQQGIELKTALVQAIQQIEKLRHREHYLTGISTGYTELNRLTCGWQNSDLVILAARPSCGKTALMLNLAVNAAKQGVCVVIFSLEMSAAQLVKRLLSIESDLFLQKIRDARLDENEMKQLYARGIQPLSKYNIIIDDKASLNVFEFRARLKKYIKKYGVKLVFGDYLQLKKGSGKKGQNREQEISEISRELKITAKECNLPVIELSQLSREVEKRSGKEPQLSDLRESGAIEQDADIIGFLYNPYSADEIKEDANKEGAVVVKIAKHRNGGLEKILFDFQKSLQKFIETGIYNSGGVQSNWRPVVDENGFPGSRSYSSSANNDNPF